MGESEMKKFSTVSKAVLAGVMAFGIIGAYQAVDPSKASASIGSGTFVVTSDFGFDNPEVSVTLLSDSYVWGSSTYVQQKVKANADPSLSYGYQVDMYSERFINNAWTKVEGSEKTVYDMTNGKEVIVNQLIAANGVYKAKGKYRIQYTFIEYNGTTGKMYFDSGTSRQFTIN